VRILLCYDGSEASRAGVPVARMLAQVPGSSIEVVRVIRIPRRGKAGSAETVGTMIAFGGAITADLHRVAAERRWEQERALFESDLEYAIGQARYECEALLPDLPEGTTIHVSTTEGEIGEVLVSHARSEDVDIIVMATHSRGPMKELFIGSVARSVVASGVAPVALIHPA